MSTEQQQQTPNGNGPAAQPAAPAAPIVKAPPSTDIVTSGEGGSVSPYGAQSEAAWMLAQRMAQSLASSSVVPDTFRGNVANCMIAMEYSSRLRVSVLAVMQNLAVIHGRPSLSSTFLIGSVNASERFTPLRYEFAGKQGEDGWACRAIARDKLFGDVLEGEWITWLMAKAEGWVQRKGSKWQTMPGQMMRYRAAAFWTRVFCPEISLGFRPTDELEDMIGVNAEETVALPEALKPKGGAEGLEALLKQQREAPAYVEAEGETIDRETGEVGAKEEPPATAAAPAASTDGGLFPDKGKKR